MSTLTYRTDLLALALAELADAASLCKSDDVASSVCSAVAHLIVGAGSTGGSAQARAISVAERAGFSVTFEPHGVRVAYATKPHG